MEVLIKTVSNKIGEASKMSETAFDECKIKDEKVDLNEEGWQQKDGSCPKQIEVSGKSEIVETINEFAERPEIEFVAGQIKQELDLEEEGLNQKRISTSSGSPENHDPSTKHKCQECNYQTQRRCDLTKHLLVVHKTPKEVNTVHFKLGETKFHKLSYQKQLVVKELGRPMPDLSIVVAGKSRGKIYKRQFNRDTYLKNNWICGSSEKNALFCFPCALFGTGHDEKPWRERGMRDLVHLSEKIKVHEQSKTHISNQMRYALFGNIQAQLDSAYWVNVQKHNEEVTKNRYILSKIIDCVKFCRAFDVALRGLNERETLENPGIFRGLINFSVELDSVLKEHLESASVFKGTKSIQNDILDCMLDVCREEILREIKEAPFLAVMADETADVSGKLQMVIVFRYVTKNGTPVERFWTFVVPDTQNGVALTDAVLDALNPVLENDKHKLIAQSYDGAAVVSGAHGGVQGLVKLQYENAHFVHCYAHQLNAIMSRACSVESQVRVFFGDLHDIPRFFNHSPQRLAVLDRNVPRSTRRNFNIRTVNVVYENRDSIVECMEQLEEESNPVTSKEARGIRRILEDPNFTFWLTFFHFIMPHVDVMYDQLRQKDVDPDEAQRAVSVFEQSINTVRNKIDAITEQAAKFETTPGDRKRKRPNNRRQSCVEVCDVIINNARERFAFTDHLVAASLLRSENFEKHNNCFPDRILDLTCDAYTFLNKERLKTELAVLYSNSECRKLYDAVPFLKFIIYNNLDETMVETKKLLQILVTTPMTTDEGERNFSTLNRIKTVLRNSMCENRLAALTMLSTEKKFIASIPNFNENVIDKFAANKERRIPLQFGKVTT